MLRGERLLNEARCGISEGFSEAADAIEREAGLGDEDRVWVVSDEEDVLLS